MLKKLTNKKGFTLMEMLIVVAIIAVLVAIAIPTFSGAMAKANQATDAANIRAAYAEAALDALNKDGAGSADSVAMVHTGKFDKIDGAKIGGADISNFEVTKGEIVTVSISEAGVVTVKCGEKTVSSPAT